MKPMMTSTAWAGSMAGRGALGCGSAFTVICRQPRGCTGRHQFGRRSPSVGLCCIPCDRERVSGPSTRFGRTGCNHGRGGASFPLRHAVKAGALADDAVQLAADQLETLVGHQRKAVALHAKVIG